MIITFVGALVSVWIMVRNKKYWNGLLDAKMT